MRLIRGEQADAELELVQKVGGLEAGSTTFPLADLSPPDFERLNYALFKTSSPPGEPRFWDEAAIGLTGADAGKDILLLKDSSELGIVQCKSLSNPMTRPALLRELSKCILFSKLDSSTPRIASRAHYFLSLTKDPTGTVLDFFAHPSQFLSSDQSEVSAAVEATLESYSSLNSLNVEDALSTVYRYLQTMNLHLLRPLDIHSWIDSESGVATRFFRHRMVVDNSEVTNKLESLSQQIENISRQTSSISPITDDDVKTIKEYIDGVPETHRMSAGFASLFGFPKEMFAGEENFRKNMEALMSALQVLHTTYIDWMSSRAQEEAARICHLPEIQATVHPFARQITVAYLGTLAADISLRSLNGKVMSNIIEKVSKRKWFSDDEERLVHVHNELLEQGRRYLAHDFSQLVGDEELIKLKRRIIGQMMTGISDAGTLERILEEGKSRLGKHLKQASTMLRSVGGIQPSVFMMGTSGLDNDSTIKQMFRDAQAIEEMNRSGKAI